MLYVKSSDYLDLLNRLDKSLDSLLTFICTRRCCNWGIPNPGPGNFEVSSFWSHHSYVGLSKHITSGNKLSEDEILKYENDIEHGLVHSICTYLTTTIYTPEISKQLIDRIWKSYDSNYRIDTYDTYNDDAIADFYNNPTDNERLVPCCLFHDILKCISNEKSVHDNHDQLLRDYFPGLDETVYTHSSPPPEDINHPLIRGDRFELLRYKDSAEWVDSDVIFNNVDDHTKLLLINFYERIRPVLQKTFKHRNERWIRHGIEDSIDDHDFTESMYPVLSTLENVDEYIINKEQDERYWAVELAKGSLGSCISQKIDNRKMSICKPGHAGRAVDGWELLQGKMPLKEYKRNLYSNKSRDHLYGNGQLPLDKWIFTHKDTGSQFKVQKMLDANIPLCHDKIVYKFLHLSEKIIDLLYGIKMDFKE